jgi:hypothetical protein
MSVYEFQFLEHNFQNNGYDTLQQINKLSTDGWWVETTNIAYPFIYILWKRPVGEAAPAEADHSGCQADLAKAQEAQAAAVRERDAANRTAADLRAQLAAAQAPPAAT